MHLEVLVVCKRSDYTFDYFAYGVDRLAFPDANAERVIVGGRVDWQRDT